MPYSQCVQFTLRATQPVPVWTAAVDAKTHQHHAPITQRALRKSFDMLSWHTEFRGVGLDRLPAILATGVDVEPATAPIFVSDFDKAWEYGGWPKVVMAFNGMHLEHTYREVICLRHGCRRDQPTHGRLPHPNRGSRWRAPLADPVPRDGHASHVRLRARVRALDTG